MPEHEQHILQKHLARFLVSEVFNLPESDDFLRIVSPNEWYYKGNALTKPQIEGLRQSAIDFHDSPLFNAIFGELRRDAVDRCVTKSKTESDLIAAKVQLHVVDLVEKKLRSMMMK